MNILKTLGIFVRDLLTYNEQLIRIGRQNFTREDLENSFIVIDDLGATIPLTRLEDYEGTLEKLSYGSIVSKPCTIDFYGDNAYTNAKTFRLMLRSQLAYELQETLGISVFSPSTMTDVKALTGQVYGNRVQLEINLQYCESITIDTLRIDVAQTSFLKDN